MVDFIDDAIDFIVEVPEHIMEIPSNIGEFFSGIFENAGEISYIGLAFALFVFIFIYALKDYMLEPFLIHMTGYTAIFWRYATYICCSFFGYWIGKGLFDN